MMENTSLHQGATEAALELLVRLRTSSRWDNGTEKAKYIIYSTEHDRPVANFLWDHVSGWPEVMQRCEIFHWGRWHSWMYWLCVCE